MPTLNDDGFEECEMVGGPADGQVISILGVPTVIRFPMQRVVPLMDEVILVFYQSIYRRSAPGRYVFSGIEQ